MNKDQVKALYPLTVAVRSLFHKMGAAATTLHKDTGMSAGKRAVLESLTNGGPQTVPQMARTRPVSRQHIQGLVNDLLDQGLVEYTDNPAHRRSKLVRTTEPGRKAFSSLRQRESEAFARLSLEIVADDLDAANRVLSRLVEAFQSTEWHAIATELSTNRTEQCDDRK
jgi:DNA-binding MarR family transcriptional regulator